ncbi:MAG TPA: hypothetical protein DD979_15535 [Gammaproteobacteria bacterium]|nr:hypothetical protein [Gammaproteobacteria bacterium]
MQLAHEIRNILKRDRTTAILVTHDQREAFAIADQIGVLNSGKLHQWDTAYSLYHRPADKFVAKFIGEGAFVRARVVSNTTLDSALGKVSGQFGDLETDTEVDLLVRPEDISYAEDSTLKGELIEKDFRGAEHRYTLRMPDDSLLLCIASGHHDHAIGDSIGICIAPQRAMVFRR